MHAAGLSPRLLRPTAAGVRMLHHLHTIQADNIMQNFEVCC
jgi:hypothetical protein